MKCVQASGVQKRKLTKKKQQKDMILVATIAKEIFHANYTLYDLAYSDELLQSKINTTKPLSSLGHC